MINKRILMGILLLAVVVSLGSAGTFAYFSDTQTSQENTIQAGTLKLNTELASTVGFRVDNALPGDGIAIAPKAIGTSFEVKNIGTTNGILTAKITDVSGGLVTTGGTSMVSALTIYIKDSTGTWQPIYNKGTSVDVQLSGDFLKDAKFNEELGYTYDKSLTEAQNQGDTFKFKIQYELKQA